MRLTADATLPAGVCVQGGDVFSVRVQPVGGGRPVHGLVVDETDSTYAVEFTPFKWVQWAHTGALPPNTT